MVGLDGVRKGGLAICRGSEWSVLTSGQPIPSDGFEA
jgi:hypothetical protein